MTDQAAQDREIARTAKGEELSRLVHSADEEVLTGVVANPALDEMQLCVLLERKNLSAEILEEVARRIGRGERFSGSAKSAGPDADERE